MFAWSVSRFAICSCRVAIASSSLALVASPCKYQATPPETAATEIPAIAENAPIRAPRRSFFSAAAWASCLALPARMYSCCKPVGWGSTSALVISQVSAVCKSCPRSSRLSSRPRRSHSPDRTSSRVWVSKCSRSVSSVRSNPAKLA